MTRDECRAAIERMLADETPMDLKLMRLCARTLAGPTSNERADKAVTDLIGAVELFDLAVMHAMPPSMVKRMRDKAQHALAVMVMVSSPDGRPGS